MDKPFKIIFTLDITFKHPNWAEVFRGRQDLCKDVIREPFELHELNLSFHPVHIPLLSFTTLEEREFPDVGESLLC